MNDGLLRYEIRIEGHLAAHRLRYFEGVSVHHEAGGDTLIQGRFRGQAELYGLLIWLQRLGAVLLLVRRVPDVSGDTWPSSS